MTGRTTPLEKLRSLIREATTRGDIELAEKTLVEVISTNHGAAFELLSALRDRADAVERSR